MGHLALWRFTHLSDDEAVAKMGHPGFVVVRKPMSQKRDPSTGSGQAIGHPAVSGCIKGSNPTSDAKLSDVRHPGLLSR